MATTTVETLVTLVLLAISATTVKSSNPQNYRVYVPVNETKMVFYFQDWATGDNPTAVPVASRNLTTNPLNFATVVVIDDAITEGPERNSTQVGRAQGIYVNSALDGSNFHLSFSVVFTNKKYNGSTLEFQGADRYLLNPREVSVVSGTGLFRFARGYALLDTVFVSGFNAIVKFTVTIRQY